MSVKLYVTILVYVIVVVIFHLFMDASDIYPQNKSILDPCKMLLPFFPDKASTFKARLVVFFATVAIALCVFFNTE